MLQRILGGVLVLLGLVAAVLGVASATVWRDTDTVVATAKPTGDGTFVVTDPGVLGLVGGDVTVSASVPEGQRVTLAVGRDVDVDGWVGNDPYSRVTGLSDWETLSSQAGAPADEEAETNEVPATGPDPAGSDMWVAEASDDGSVTLRWSDRPGRWSLLAAGVGEGAQAPTLELTWPRTVSTPFLWPGVGIGAGLVVIGAVLLVLGGRRVRAERADAASRTDGYDDAGSDGGGAEPGDEPGDAGPAAPARRSFGARSPFGPVRSDADAPAATPAESGAATDTSATDDPRTDRPDAADGDHADDGTAHDAAGTAEVPLANRLLRRSRRREREALAQGSHDAPQDAAAQDVASHEAGGDPADVAPAPAASHFADVAPAPEHEPVPSEPLTATGAMRMTRRELRAQEEARRAAEQGGGMTRMLRAITGSIPAVRPQPAEAEGEPGVARPDASTPAGRAAAWRATWGFGDAGRTGPADDARTTDDDGENR